jgi:hypothetical protein
MVLSMERGLSLNCEAVPVQQNMASADCPVSRPGERHQFRRASRRCQPTARTAPVWGAASASSLAAAAAPILVIASAAATVWGSCHSPLFSSSSSDTSRCFIGSRSRRSWSSLLFSCSSRDMSRCFIGSRSRGSCLSPLFSSSRAAAGGGAASASSLAAAGQPQLGELLQPPL